MCCLTTMLDMTAVDAAVVFARVALLDFAGPSYATRGSMSELSLL